MVNKEAKQDDPKKRKPDITRAKEQLNWQPKVIIMVFRRYPRTYYCFKQGCCFICIDSKFEHFTSKLESQQLNQPSQLMVILSIWYDWNRVFQAVLLTRTWFLNVYNSHIMLFQNPLCSLNKLQSSFSQNYEKNCFLFHLELGSILYLI